MGIDDTLIGEPKMAEQCHTLDQAPPAFCVALPDNGLDRVT